MTSDLASLRISATRLCLGQPTVIPDSKIGEALLAALDVVEAAEANLRESAAAHGETPEEFVSACTTAEGALLEKLLAFRRLYPRET